MGSSKRIFSVLLVAVALFTAAARPASTQLPSTGPATVGGEKECETTIYWYWDPYWGPVFLWAEETCVTIIDD